MKNTILLLLFGWRLSAVGATLISPTHVNGSGNTGSSAPLEFPMRYQQVYQASEFTAAMPQGGTISTITFKVDETIATIACGDIPSIQLDLSTSQRGVNSLNPVFANNIGPDNVTVFGPGRIDFAGSPGQFAFVFLFSHPFFYDPRAGNLLLDVRNYSGAVVCGFTDGPGVDAVQGGQALVSQTWT
jgi:hypothetical protein